MSDVFDKHEYVIGKVHGDNFDGICLDYNGDIQATIVDLVAEVWALRERVKELEAAIEAARNGEGHDHDHPTD